MAEGPNFDKLIGQLDTIELTTVHGRITEIVGMLIKAVVPNVKMGEVCAIKREEEPLLAEVVGFTKQEVYLSPLGEMSGIGPSSEVIPMRLPLHIKVGPALLGRVLDGTGHPLDTSTKGPLEVNENYSVINPPPRPVKTGDDRLAPFGGGACDRRRLNSRTGTAHWHFCSSWWGQVDHFGHDRPLCPSRCERHRAHW